MKIVRLVALTKSHEKTSHGKVELPSEHIKTCFGFEPDSSFQLLFHGSLKIGSVADKDIFRK